VRQQLTLAGRYWLAEPDSMSIRSAEAELPEVVSRQKAPALGTIAEVTSKSQHVNIELRGFLQISNGENTTGIDDAVHVRTPAQLTTCPANAAAVWRGLGSTDVGVPHKVVRTPSVQIMPALSASTTSTVLEK